MAKRVVKTKQGHKWAFRARFRRRAFGWRSSLPIKRIKEAVAEIKKVARADPLLAGEGGVLFLEKLSPAIEQVDGSSGSIGNAAYNAILALVPIIAQAPADAKTRAAWCERLWAAQEADDMPYLEGLGDHWGELCGSKEVASRWADELIDRTREAATPDPKRFRFFKGATNCLSALLVAERHDELLALLELEGHRSITYRQFGVRALAAQRRTDEALRFAAESDGRYGGRESLSRICEEILFAEGRTEEAYERYGLQANSAATYLTWFRKVVKRYPHKDPAEVLNDLVKRSPGAPGKWFAAAKSAKLFDQAIELANRSPCDPKTLTRAARDFAKSNPMFALEAGMAALRWLVAGVGYEITNLDVVNAYTYTLEAAENAGKSEGTRQRIKTLVASETIPDRFVTKALGRRLKLS